MSRKRTKKDNKKGFTLVELLATIIIISLIFSIASYYVMNIVNSSKDKSKEVTMSSIKKAANLYGNEKQDDSLWKVDSSGTLSTACVSLNELVNSGYLKRKQIEDIDEFSYIILTRNENGVIISSAPDNLGMCGGIVKPIAIPTSNKFCNNLSYNGNNQTLTKALTGNEGYTFSNNIGKNAGNYTVTARLSSNNFMWKDGSNSEKTFVCNIKKAMPSLTLNPTSSGNASIGSSTTVRVTSNVNGILKVTSTNVEHIKATFGSSSISNINKNETKDMTITTLSSRDTTTYVDVTLTPTDTNNYYTNTQVYTIGKIDRMKVTVPDSSFCKKNLSYNHGEQLLVENPKEGYVFINKYGTYAGSYEIVAQLKYGYQWDRANGKLDDVKFTCKIEHIVPKFKVIAVTPRPSNDNNIFTGDTSSGSLMKSFSFIITLQAEVPGSISVKKVGSNADISRVAVTNGGSISQDNGTFDVIVDGIDITTGNVSIQSTLSPTDNVNYITNTANYNVKIVTNQFKVTYDNMGGSGCTSFISTYKSKYGDLCTPTRSGYSFSGWYTAKTGGNKVTKDTVSTTAKEHTLYARWNANSYVIVFNGNGATGGSTAKTNCSYDSSCTLTKNGFIRQYTVSYNGNGGSTPNSNTVAYIFKGWATSKTGSVAYNDEASSSKFATSGTITLYAIWGASDVKLPTSTKSGYTINGWYDGSASVGNAGTSYTPTKTITLKASWKANDYTVKFDKNNNGATGTTNPTSCTYGTSCTLTANGFSRTGYTFDGWATSKTGTKVYGNKATSSSFTTSGTITLYVVWKPIVYNIKFDGNGATSGSMSSVSATYDLARNLPDNKFTKTDAMLDGWATSKTGAKVYENKGSVKNLSSTNGDTVTLYAKWRRDIYTIKFNSNGGKGTTADVTCKYGVSCTLTTNGFSKSYTVSYDAAGGTIEGGISNNTAVQTFKNWKHPTTNNTYEDKAKVTDLTQDDSITLSAQWTPTSFKLPNATKPGYTFGGWYDGTTKAGNAGASYTPSKNITLKASWTANKYTVKFDKNSSGATGTTSATTCTYGTSCKLTTNGFSWGGHEFKGWATEKEGNVIYNDGATSSSFTTSGTITLYARWSSNNYTIKFNGNGSTGGSTNSVNCVYGTSCTLTANGFIRQYTVSYNGNGGSTPNSNTVAYEFKGWATSATGSVAYNNKASSSSFTTYDTLNLYAVWGPKSISLASTSKTGYIFGGWYDGSTKIGNSGASYTPTKNISLKANWSPITYKIAFNGNGSTSGNMSTITATYDQAITLPSNSFGRSYTVTYNADGGNATKSSDVATYSFNGWATSSGGSKEYNDKASVSNLTSSNNGTVTLYANWSPSSVTLPNATKTNYVFGGWYDGSTKAGDNGGSYTPSKNVTLKATWGLNTYTIIYNSNGGTGTMDSTTCTRGVSCTLRANSFTKTGYSFKGWGTTSSSGVVYSDSASSTGFTTSSTLTLYAQWRANTCTINYDPNGGSFTKNTSTTQAVNYSASTSIRGANGSYGAKLAGYHYGSSDWYSSSGSSINASTYYSASSLCGNSLNTGDASVTLYVNWNPNICTINYSENGGSFTKNSSDTDQQVAYGSSTSIRGANGTYGATKTGHRIGSPDWSGGISGGTSYSATDLCNNLDTGNRSITLNVNWKANTCTINYDPNGGSFTKNTSTTQGVSYGNSTSIRNADGSYGATKTGYHIDSTDWSGGINGGTSYSATDLCGSSLNSGDASVTLSANWKANVCTINYSPGSGSFTKGSSTTQSFKYGNTTSLRTASGGYGAKRSGYSIASPDWGNFTGGSSYSATDLCGSSINYGDASVTLTVSWYRYLYRTRTYSTCISGANTCKGGNVCKSGYVCPTGTTPMSDGKCKLCINDNCSMYERKNKVYSSCATTTYSSCATGSNTCVAGYSSWSSWTTTSCNTSNTNTCESKIDYS